MRICDMTAVFIKHKYEWLQVSFHPLAIGVLLLTVAVVTAVVLLLMSPLLSVIRSHPRDGRLIHIQSRELLGSIVGTEDRVVRVWGHESVICWVRNKYSGWGQRLSLCLLRTFP